MFAAHEVVATAHADGPALPVAVAAQDDSLTAMVAAQGDSPTATVAAQDDGSEAAVTLPQKKKKVMWQGRKSLSKSQIVNEIGKDVHFNKGHVRTVLDALAEIGLRELQSVGVFTVPGLASLKVQCQPQAKTGRKCIIRRSRQGNRYYLKEQPGRLVMAAPALKIKRGINPGYRLRISRSIDAASPPATKDGVCSDIGQ